MSVRATSSEARGRVHLTTMGDRVVGTQTELPRSWYNVLADLPFPLTPPISPATGGPVSPEELLRIFPPQLLEQESSGERFIALRTGSAACWSGMSK